MPFDGGSLVPVKAHCTEHQLRRAFHLLLLCNYYKDFIFFIQVSSGTPASKDIFTSGRQRSCHQHICIICFSNFLEWLSWPFDVQGCSWDPASALRMWKKLDLLSHTLFSVIGAQIRFGLLTANFCCAQLVNRVSLLEYLGHDLNPSQGADRIYVAKTRIRKVLIVGKQLFSLALLTTKLSRKALD